MLRIIQKLIRIRRPLSIDKFILVVAILMTLIYYKRLRDLNLQAPDATETTLNEPVTDGKSTESLQTDFEFLQVKAVLDKMVFAVGTSKKITIFI